jgi:hypothetical protein
MQDEHFMQSWNSSHRRLSADIDRGLARLADRLSGRAKRSRNIGDAYGLPPATERRPALPPAAAASLRGFAATVITAALWVLVMALATPAPGLAASIDSVMTTCACLAHPPLA